MIVKYQNRTIEVKALVMNDVNFSFILSRPDMRRLKLNISWKDELTIDSTLEENCLAQETQVRTVRNADEILTTYPELICVGAYPPATPFLEVPFKLRDTNVVRKKPYPLSHEKKVWLKNELQQMLDANIIRPSTSPFASPITIVPKEDGTFRLCTDYRLINRQTCFHFLCHGSMT